MAVEHAMAALQEHWDDVLARLGPEQSRQLRTLIEDLGGADHARIVARIAGLLVAVATKAPRPPSEVNAHIDRGLEALIELIRVEKIDSVAVPPLGCGNGGLSWSDVRPRIERALSLLARLCPHDIANANELVEILGVDDTERREAERVLVETERLTTLGDLDGDGVREVAMTHVWETVDILSLVSGATLRSP